MSRYIDADKLCNLARNNIDGTVDANDIMRFPTADVVEVTRCKDCKFYKPYDKPCEDFDGWCLARNCETDEYDFCNYGDEKGSEWK